MLVVVVVLLIPASLLVLARRYAVVLQTVPVGPELMLCPVTVTNHFELIPSVGATRSQAVTVTSVFRYNSNLPHGRKAKNHNKMVKKN